MMMVASILYIYHIHSIYKYVIQSNIYVNCITGEHQFQKFRLYDRRVRCQCQLHIYEKQLFKNTHCIYAPRRQLTIQNQVYKHKTTFNHNRVYRQPVSGVCVFLNIV